ncbi:ABC-type nitrate/sulfonate/bicarbonate transport system, permease component [Frankia canadensis]|uniref:ABC-type nitrate/sulfonate/bicarbonate transport system, permease component n=1 Tax=Frankia canadensis TaxID=1836972 RepID=A0A2I2L240_9ACTN|nr:ABC transporter permease [Frankia canadensis]SNQ51990.1 ABC-type nitrate/sulfonate/bicarbonate transport system, permease component [Frankia canadensis]SOU59280.1 ABC-type nitrate/sulfonate/bicarbonate transport system, permease component [Frankia canadensis]
MATEIDVPTRAHERPDLAKARPGDAPEVDATLAGLDALDIPTARRAPLLARSWAATWPKLGALVLFLLLWQVVVWTGWKPTYVLPGPVTALREFGSRLGTGHFWEALARTLVRAVEGYALAVLIGGVVGVAVARFTLLRTAVGSFITALQTMPSIVWFPLAILLFKLSESAIMFVVILGAAPSVANGVIYGVDYVPPLLVRVGRSMGARGFSLYRHVVAPAALPSVLAGLKQGWAFAWRSLMAGELLVIVPGHPSIGADLQNSRELIDTVGVMASMITIFVVGVIVDAAFNAADARMRQRRGLVAEGNSAVRAARGRRKPPNDGAGANERANAITAIDAAVIGTAPDASSGGHAG